MDSIPVIIYTDGACSGNPGPGGWAAILQFGAQERVLQGGASLTTNNRMELRAAVAALQALRRPCQVELHTDSQYLRLGITQWAPNWIRRNWMTSQRNAVKNRDLWQLLLAASQPHEIRWLWVRGHAGSPLNERADQLAVAALNTLGVGGEPDLQRHGAPVPG